MNAAVEEVLMADAILGPGAKGDPDNPGARPPRASELVEDATAEEVIEAVRSGEVSAEDALAAEGQREQPRKTVMREIGGSE